jgi:N-methylhydantoinase B
MEMLSPVRVLASRLVPGSGGEGRFRGGLAIERDYEILASEALVACQTQQTSRETAPWGLDGGDGGMPAAAVLNPGRADERPLPARLRHTPFRRGDVVRMRSAGGGGFGDPKTRSPAARARDEAEGYV